MGRQVVRHLTEDFIEPLPGSGEVAAGQVHPGLQHSGIDGSMRLQFGEEWFQLGPAFLAQIQFGQSDAGGVELRRFREDGTPVFFGIGEVSLVAIEQGQMVSHQRPPQTRIDAGKGAFCPHLPPPRWGRVWVGGAYFPLPWWGRAGVGGAYFPPPWWGRVWVGNFPPPWWGRVRVGDIRLCHQEGGSQQSHPTRPCPDAIAPLTA